MNPKARMTITPKSLEVEELNFNDGMQLIFSALLQLMNQAVDNFTSNEEEQEQLRDSIYDAVNEASTAVLDKFDPNKSRLRNEDVDIEEVMARQDVIINDAYSKLKATNPRLFRKQQKLLRRAQDEIRYKKAVLESKGETKEETS